MNVSMMERPSKKGDKMHKINGYLTKSRLVRLTTHVWDLEPWCWWFSFISHRACPKRLGRLEYCQKWEDYIASVMFMTVVTISSLDLTLKVTRHLSMKNGTNYVIFDVFSHKILDVRLSIVVNLFHLYNTASLRWSMSKPCWGGSRQIGSYNSTRLLLLRISNYVSAIFSYSSGILNIRVHSYY